MTEVFLDPPALVQIVPYDLFDSDLFSVAQQTFIGSAKLALAATCLTSRRQAGTCPCAPVAGTGHRKPRDASLYEYLHIGRRVRWKC